MLRTRKLADVLVRWTGRKHREIVRPEHMIVFSRQLVHTIQVSACNIGSKETKWPAHTTFKIGIGPARMILLLACTYKLAISTCNIDMKGGNCSAHTTWIRKTLACTYDIRMTESGLNPLHRFERNQLVGMLGLLAFALVLTPRVQHKPFIFLTPRLTARGGSSPGFRPWRMTARASRFLQASPTEVLYNSLVNNFSEKIMKPLSNLPRENFQCVANQHAPYSCSTRAHCQLNRKVYLGNKQNFSGNNKR
jgi:hypothetical protein